MIQARKQFHINEILTSFHSFYFRNISVGLIYFLILSSCEFNPGEIKETYVEKPSEEVPMIGFELTPETDTLRLFEPVTIKYKFDASPRKVHWVEFSFDGVVLLHREYELDNSLEMNINPHLYGEGLHTLKIMVVTSSNSGSIADKVQAEGYSYQLEWPVLIDFTPPKPLKILSVTQQPGGAIVKWEKFSHASFKNYTLDKIPFFENISSNIAVITDRNTTQFFDTDYLEGENVYYHIWCSGLSGEGFYFSVPPGSITATWTSGFNATVNWEPTQNPKRLDYYRIFLKDQISPQDEKHVRFEEKREIIYKLGLGTNIQINLQNVPKTTNTNFSYGGLQVSSTIAAIGNPIPVHELAKKVYGTNYTLMNNGNKLILYDHANRVRLDSLDFGNAKLRAYRISPDGKTLFTLIGDEFEAWEIEGFLKLKSISLSEINSKLASLYDISVSSDFKILFTVSGEKIVVYDFKNNKVLIAPDQSVGWSKISPDGKRVVARFTQVNTFYRCYDIESNQLTLKGETVFPGETWGNYFFFSRQDLDQLIICHDTEVQIRKLSDFALINTLSLSSFGYADFDPETNLLIWAKDISSECNLMKLPGGEITKTVFLSRGNVILHRDFLIGKNGRQLNLSNL